MKLKQFVSLFIILCLTVFIVKISTAQERDALDVILDENDKAQIEDIIATSQAISKESQEKLKEAIEQWEKLEENFPNLPKPLQDKINEINQSGLKNKIKAFQKQFKQFDKGLKYLLDKKEELDQVIYFYDRYSPDSQNPFRSLEVMENAFTDIESWLPEEQEYEYIKNTSAWLIRTGLRYFKTAIQNALGGLRSIQKQIKDRAGNCIGFVGGDATADSSDPKRKAFTDLNSGNTICYTGIRPVGGELWSDETGAFNYVWDNNKWTKLNCGLGTASEIFKYWKIAYGNAISVADFIHWCNDRIGTYQKDKARAQMHFRKMATVNRYSCQEEILQLLSKYNAYLDLMDIVSNDSRVFEAKYIFNTDNVRALAEDIASTITGHVILYGYVEDDNDKRVPNASVEINTASQKIETLTDSWGNFRKIGKIDFEQNRALGASISISAPGYEKTTVTTQIYQQCQNLGQLTIKSSGNLVIVPEKSAIKVGESIDFKVLFTDTDGTTDVTSVALNNPKFLAINKGKYTIQAFYGQFSATATIEVSSPDSEEVDDGLTVDDLPEEINCTGPNEEKVWDDNLQRFVCRCMDGYITDPATGFCVEDVQTLVSNSDCANDPEAIAEWDDVNKVVRCRCVKDFYIWDAAQKKCVPDIQAILANSDCSQYPNTQPIWDYNYNEPICDCKTGYVWNKENTGCIEGKSIQVANADCSGYPNAYAVWDDNLQEVICECLPGYVWNKEETGCIPEWEEALANADCSAYQNTEPVWDPVAKEVYCDCKAGYEWNANNTGCDDVSTEQPLTNGCTQYPNTEPVWDPSSNQYFCDCIAGYKWNRKRTGCVPERQKPNIDWDGILVATIGILNTANQTMPGTPQSIGTTGSPASQPPVVHQSNCNDKQEAGGDAPEVHNINLGQSYGTFMFDYETYSVKDQIIVSQGGTVLFNSGCVGQSGSIPLTLNGFSTTITVRVNPNCDGTSGTSWNFTVHCPK